MQNESFEDNKRITLLCLEKIHNMAEKLQIAGIAEKSGKDIELLGNEKFTLVVIGEFSRGKSTFVNALLGAGVLPSSKEPTTNVISKIVYGNDVKFLLHYKNGKVKSVSEENFKKIKAQSEPSMTLKEQFLKYIGVMQDFSKIEFVEIQRPVDFCKNKVEIVDTPGTNDLNVARMEITYDYLNKADAAILLLSATQAYSKSEDEFLQERVLGNQIKDIFVVVNYKDQLDNIEQEQEVKEYVKRQIEDLEKRANADLSAVKNRIFMVSSRQALLFKRKTSGEILKPKTLMDVPETMESTGFVDFESALENYLFTERGNAKIEKYRQRCADYLAEIEHFIVDEKNAYSKSLSELKNIREEESKKFPLIQKGTTDIAEELKRRLSLVEGDLIALSDRTANLIMSAVRSAVDEYEQSHGKKLSVDGVQQAVNFAVSPVQKKFIEEVNDIQKNKIATECLWASNELSKILGDIVIKNENSEISDLYFNGTDLRTLSNEMYKIKSDGGPILGNKTVTMASYLAYRFLGPLAGLSTMVVSFTAMYAIRGWNSNSRLEDMLKVWGEIKVKIYEQAQRNTNALGEHVCTEYRKLVENACNEIKRSIDSRINDLQNQTSRLIKMKEQEKGSLAEKVNKLDEIQGEISQVKDELKGVKL